MRDLTEPEIERLRIPVIGIEIDGKDDPRLGGYFVLPSPIDRKPLRIIASNDASWDHVSVSREKRIPNWLEMEHVAKLFFKPDEWAFQLHAPPSEHINQHPFVLHWWRSHTVPIPIPPRVFV